MKNILLICGSTKPRSSNEKILDFIAEAMARNARAERYNDLKNLPYFEPGLTEEQLPYTVKVFLAKIEAADAVIISTPEYVFSLPGIIKNALEWTVATTVFSYKPVALIVAAASGEKALESLDLIVSTLIQSAVPEQRKLLISGVSKYFDQSGQINSDEIKTKLISLSHNLLEKL